MNISTCTAVNLMSCHIVPDDTQGYTCQAVGWQSLATTSLRLSSYKILNPWILNIDPSRGSNKLGDNQITLWLSQYCIRSPFCLLEMRF